MAGLGWQKIAGIVTGIVFIVLLSIRLDLFPVPATMNTPSPTKIPESIEDREVWMQILQNGRKIGYAHRMLSPAAEGYEFSDDVLMRINTMGVVQGLTFSTKGMLNRDMTLSTFQVKLSSNMFRFEARGRCVGKRLTLFVQEAGEEKKHELELKDVPYVPVNIIDAAFRAGLRPGEPKTLHIFDPASMGMRPVKISWLGDDTGSSGKETRKLVKLSVDYLGNRQTAWIDEQRRIVREEGMLGLVLERTTKDVALRDISSSASADMTELASVAAGVSIRKPESLQKLVVKIENIDPRLFGLGGDRQSYRGGILSIQKELLSHKAMREPPVDSNAEAVFLKATPFIQADHPDMQKAVKGIVSSQDASHVKMRKIVEWVYRHVEKQPVLSVSSALETLAQRKGDCTEHAVLVAALGRAAGIPATIETGLVYQRERFYYHAWNVFYIREWNQWITADAVFNQVPADVTHIRFIRGEAQDQLNLMGLIGRVKIAIMEEGS